jgi:alkylhydroperoxidase/carboxymuconolactone decarboxylase family protein YurZ
MNEEQHLADGKRICTEFYAGALPAPVDTGGDPYSEGTLKYLFSDVLGRNVLKNRDKRFIIMGALAGLGADPSLFEIHARAAIASGDVTAQEIYEYILLVLHYVGHPRTTVLKRVVDKLVAEAART